MAGSGLKERNNAENPPSTWDAKGALHTLAICGADGLSWVDVCLTGLTKILLLCVQSQNPAPGDV